MASMGLLGGLASGFDTLGNYFIDSAKQQRQHDLDLDSYKQKEQFSNMLQQQLMEKKVQLAQQYPEYTKFVTNPRTGAVTGITPFGHTAVLSQGDPEQAQIWDSYKQSMIDKNKSAASENQARLGLISAQTEAANAAAKLSGVKAAAGGFAPRAAKAASDPMGLSPSAYKTMIDQTAASLAAASGDKDAVAAFGPAGKIADLSGEVTAKYKQLAEEQIKKRGFHIKGETSGLLGSSNNFSDLIPSQQTSPTSDDEEEEQDDNLNPMSF